MQFLLFRGCVRRLQLGVAMRTFTDGNSCLASDISSKMEEEGDDPLLVVEIFCATVGAIWVLLDSMSVANANSDHEGNCSIRRYVRKESLEIQVRGDG